MLVADNVFVTTGSTRGDQVAILAGVAAGDTVVTAGHIKLRDGGAGPRRQQYPGQQPGQFDPGK